MEKTWKVLDKIGGTLGVLISMGGVAGWTLHLNPGSTVAIGFLLLLVSLKD